MNLPIKRCPHPPRLKKTDADLLVKLLASSCQKFSLTTPRTLLRPHSTNTRCVSLNLKHIQSPLTAQGCLAIHAHTSLSSLILLR